MKKKILNKISIALILLSAVMVSCEKDEVFTPSVSTVNSSNDDITVANQGFPNDLIIVEGTELNNMKSIQLVAGNDTVDVVYNPVLNSAVAVMFNIPFDESKGSKLGAQQILFTNTNNKSVSAPFEILQPDPVIKAFNPERPKAGESTIIQGEWFQNLQDVTFDGSSVEFEQLSSTEIYVAIPEGATPADIVVTTGAGNISAALDVDIGYNVYMYTNFDGEGLFPANDWWTNGDLADVPASFSSADGYDGNYIEVTWSGSSANGWGNTEPGSVGDPGIVETNTEDVLFVCEVYCASAAGSVFEIQIDDGTGANWALTAPQFTAEQVGKWVTVELSTYDFKRNYGGGEATHDMDLQGIMKVKIGIPQWTGVAPTIVRIDNMRFHGYY